MEAVFVLLRMASFGWAVITIPLSLLLLCVGDSFEGKVFACAAMVIGATPLLACIGKELESKRLKYLAAIGGLIGVSLTIWLAVSAPDGRRDESAKVQHRYASGTWEFQTHALGNLLPELDQFLLGFRVVPLLDSLFTQKQATSLSDLTTEIYHELEADPDFHALGSVMPDAYADLWFGRSDQGHSFLYIPQKLDRESPAPVLVFLHGSGGNFKAYTWLLSRIADDLGMVLVCPSYGMGNWTAADSAAVIRAALQDAEKDVKLDRGRMHLMGLSNGGKGVGHAGRDMGDAFQSLTLISPVVEMLSVTSPKFVSHWKGRPVFILAGARDDRVPLQSVSYVASVMEKNGADVTLTAVPDADHFLLFSHRDEVIAMMTKWLAFMASK